MRKPKKYIRHFHGTDKINFVCWKLDGKLHREDGPAYISYYIHDQTLYSERWCINGLPHREDGPAEIFYSFSGGVTNEHWYLNDKRHRIDGPAWIDYHPSGKIKDRDWYLNDKRIRPEQWLKENRYRWPLNKEKQTELLLTFG